MKDRQAYIQTLKAFTGIYMTDKKLETESITKAIYHLGISKQFFEAFRDSCRLDAKRQAGLWVGKVDFVLSDVYAALTPKARELYHEEIKNGDVLFLPSLSEKLLRMTPEQREFVELMCVQVLRGEKIEVHDLEGRHLTVN